MTRQLSLPFRRAARRSAALFALTAALLLSGARGAAGGPDDKKVPEDLREPVVKAVQRACAYMARKQRADGSFAWGVPERPAWLQADGPAWDGALTCLATLAMARGGAGLEHPTVRRALAYLKAVVTAPEPPSGTRDLRTTTYGTGALLWLLSELRPPGFQRAAAQAAFAIANGPTSTGLWSYAVPWVVVDASETATIVRRVPSAGTGDVSNTQFAVLGLLAAERMGVYRGPGPWARLRGVLKRLAQEDGGFPYTADPSQPDALRRSYRVGTHIGAASYHLAMRRTGVSEDDCAQDEIEKKALDWITRHPSFIAGSSRWAAEPGEKADPPPYYELMTLERLGVFLHQEKVAGMAWYRQGARLLFSLQAADGSWPAQIDAHGYHDGVENTALAVLFLTRAVDVFSVTTPSLTPTDLAAAGEIPDPLFSELVFRGLRSWAASEDEVRAAWRRAFVSAGPRTMLELARLVGEGPTATVDDADDLLAALTATAKPPGHRGQRSQRWLDWIAESRARLIPSADGTAFDLKR